LWVLVGEVEARDHAGREVARRGVRSSPA